MEQIQIGGRPDSNAPAWIKVLDWFGESKYYETIQFADIDTDDKDHKPVLIGRSWDGLHALKYNPKNNAWDPFGTTLSEMSDQAGWGDEKYYRTIQFADIDGDTYDELIGRFKDGLHAWKFITKTGTWDQLAIHVEMGDAHWGEPEYYETIQLGDIDHDGKAELIGRGEKGIHALKYDKGAWSYLAIYESLMSDAGGWNSKKYQYYKTIQLADIDHDGYPELIARGSAGLHVWRYIKKDNNWKHLDKALINAMSDPGWAHPQYQETIQFADINGDGSAELIVRGSAGLFAYKFNKGESWDLLGTISGMCDAAGWYLPQYYRTIQFADINGDGSAELIVRGSNGLFAYKYNPNNKAWDPLGNTISDMSDKAGWDQPKYYETIHLADIDGDKRAELTARFTDIICKLQP